MKYFKYQSVLLSSVFLLFLGCGGDVKNSSNPNESILFFDENSEANKTAQKVTSEECQVELFNSTISPILNNCVSCHSEGGQAQTTKFLLLSPSLENKEKNYQILKSYIEESGDYIIQKGTNSAPHGGGVQLTSTTKASLQSFIEYIDGTTICHLEERAPHQISVELISNERALRSVSILLAGRSPTDEELQKSSNETEFDKILDNYMQSEPFYAWLQQNFNDFLLTDFYMPSRSAEDLLNGNDFPNRRWYDVLESGGKITRSTRNTLLVNTNYAIAKEPIELMVHVIKENRPFSEILTADYLLVNAYSARTYGIDEEFTISDEDINKSVDTLNETFPKDKFFEAKVAGIPHAGLLTSIAYLNRFPSTNTNLDRHRSAKTQLFFFDTDILSLANRPINSIEVVSDTATWTNPNCTVCHNIMEPIASSFKNWDNSGRYRPGFRGDASQVPGLSIEHRAPADASQNLLQWLTKEMVKDDRFAMASVKIFLKALLKRDALKKPQSDEADYTQKLEAYHYEQDILKAIMKKFIASNMNAKVIIKELIKSPLYRAKAVENADGSTQEFLNETLGVATLITPEKLDQKIYDTMGWYYTHTWVKNYRDNNRSDYHKLLNDSQFKILYGGINSGSVATRVSELNGVMANIQLRMALQMSCFPVSLDFFREEKSSRKLFPYVTKTLEPDTEFAIQAIKKNIQYLHKHILNEDVTLDSEELLATYKIFQDTYLEGKARVKSLSESKELQEECKVHYDPITGQGLWLNDENGVSRNDERIIYDSKYIIRSWQAVITYLLSDFKFLYNSNVQ